MQTNGNEYDEDPEDVLIDPLSSNPYQGWEDTDYGDSTKPGKLDLSKLSLKEGFAFMPSTVPLVVRGVSIIGEGDLITVRIRAKRDLIRDQNVEFYCACARVLGYTTKIIKRKHINRKTLLSRGDVKCRKK